MKKEFKIISNYRKNTRVLRCWLWRWNVNGIFKENKKIDVRGLEISKNNVQKCIVKD